MPSGTRILGRRTVKGCVSETRGAQVACGKPILRWGVGRRGGGPPPAARRPRLLPPKPVAGVHLGGGFVRVVVPGRAGGPPGASGPPRCHVSTSQWGRIGVPHANWATWASNMLRFCGPAGQKRRAAREPDDPDPQRTDKTRQNRHTRLRFLDTISVFADRDVESP